MGGHAQSGHSHPAHQHPITEQSRYGDTGQHSHTPTEEVENTGGQIADGDPLQNAVNTKRMEGKAGKTVYHESQQKQDHGSS